jgi:flavodoxin
MKTLVVYYSLSNGNTKRIAEKIATHLGADIAQIDTVKPYTGSYDDIVNQGQDEVERGYMPALKELNVNIADYDKIVIGTPTWWYTMAPAVLTFLKDNNFTGKTVIPFQTHGGWPGHCIEDMTRALKGAKVEKAYNIRFDSEGGSRMITSAEKLDKWVNSL